MFAVRQERTHIGVAGAEGGSEANDTALQFVYYRNNYMGCPLAPASDLRRPSLCRAGVDLVVNTRRRCMVQAAGEEDHTGAGAGLPWHD